MRSRSHTIPTTALSSTTTTAPTRCLASAASRMATGASGLTVATTAALARSTSAIRTLTALRSHRPRLTLRVPPARLACYVSRARYSAYFRPALRRPALASRTISDQAVGIIMGQNRCTADEAGEILRAASSHLNLKLRDIVGDIVTRVSATSGSLILKQHCGVLPANRPISLRARVCIEGAGRVRAEQRERVSGGEVVPEVF